MRKKLQLLLLLLFAFYQPDAQQVQFKSYTVQDGLVANPVRCIYQDSKGFIWIGTFEGLSRYDGYKFTNYTNNNGLSHNFINSLLEIDGKLLVAENNGAVDVIENNSIQKKFQAGSAVNKIMPYENSVLLSTDISGLYEYKNGKFIHPPQEKLAIALGSFIRYNDSILLAEGVDDNLIFFRKNFTIHHTVTKLATHFYFLFRDSRNRTWTGTSNGLKLLSATINKKRPFSFLPLPPFFSFEPLRHAQVTSMVEEKDGGFWIGTNKGLVHLFADGSYQVHSEKDGLPSAHVNTLYFDREENLWIGTMLGLAKWVSKNNVIFFNSEKKQFRHDISSIHLLPDQKIILNSQHGLQQFDYRRKEFNDIGSPTKSWYMPVTGTWPLLLYYGDSIGVFNHDKNGVRYLRKLDASAGTVFSSRAHSSGIIFLGSGQGLFAVNNTRVQKILPHRITCLTTDQKGFLWAGTWLNGLFRIETKKGNTTSYEIQNFTSLVGQNEIRSLYHDRKQNVWVGTRYGGVFRLQSKDTSFEILNIKRSSGLMSDWVKSIAELDNGDMWIGTYLGLDRLVKEANGYRVFNFSRATNFFAQIESIQPAGEGNWICLANTGIACFHDEDLHKTLPLNASILSASLGQSDNQLTLFSPEEKVFLNHYQNAARFEFSALGFFNEKQVMYSYRLKGKNDTTWSNPENIHEASYPSLPPGNYTFEVRTIGFNGKAGTPESFSFSIQPPFWKTTWFYVLCIAVIGLFFYVLYRYRINQLLRIQKVRNRIATDLHDDIGSTLTNISVLSELSDQNLEHPAKARQYLHRITEEVNASGQALDDIIWSVNTNNDTLDEMVARMRRFASEIFDHTTTEYHFILEETSSRKKVDMEHRKDIYLVFKEAINNIYKHAAAQNVFIRLSFINQFLEMEIKDDGRGFNTNSGTPRNGLKNLKTRVQKWKGTITIESGSRQGTRIQVKIPVKSGTTQMNR